jgi:hypothetical protein
LPIVFMQHEEIFIGNERLSVLQQFLASHTTIFGVVVMILLAVGDGDGSAVGEDFVVDAGDGRII